MKLHALGSTAVAIPDGKSKDTIKLACTVCDDARAISIMAVNSANHCYTSKLDEVELSRIKNAADGNLSWDDFVKAIDAAFSDKHATVAESGSTLTLTFKAGSGNAQFTLQSTNEANGSLKYLETLFDLYKARTDDKLHETQQKDLTKRLEDLKAKEKHMEVDKKKAHDNAAAAAADEKAAMELFVKLTAELTELQTQLKKEREARGEDPNLDADDAPQEPEPTGCVGRVPHEDICRGYDKFLLNMLKSKFTPLEDEDVEGECPSHMNVLKPFSKNEFQAQLNNLPVNSKKAVITCMEKIDAWDYDVFTIQDMTDKGSLFHTAYALFVRYDFLRKFNLNEEVVLNFLSQVEAGYHPNPYHNSMHAADVLHIVHYILSPGGLAKTARLTDEDIFASLIAGMIHDYDHPGINNNFHIKVQSYLSTLYNDRSILENHHCAEVFELMKNPKFNILAPFGDDQRRDIRETIIEMVLSTDMGLHAKILGTWKRRIATDQDLHVRKDDQRLALSMAIKMADISNCGRPEKLYLRWSSKIAEEFFLQGDRERNLGNPVSPFMDRYIPSMAKGQIAFMNYIVIPLFESISEYLPEMHFSVDHCEQNKSYWATNDDTIS